MMLANDYPSNATIVVNSGHDKCRKNLWISNSKLLDLKNNIFRRFHVSPSSSMQVVIDSSFEMGKLCYIYMEICDVVLMMSTTWHFRFLKFIQSMLLSLCHQHLVSIFYMSITKDSGIEEDHVIDEFEVGSYDGYNPISDFMNLIIFVLFWCTNYCLNLVII